MNLYSGLPYWIAKNPLFNYYNPLQTEITTEVLIIGGGITGALVAHELCSGGIKCTLIDKRSIATGSSTASTALLQYEIDTPLHKLTEIYPEELAVKAYRYCLQSITDIENIFHLIEYNPDFERVPSIFYASNHSGTKLIKREYEIRKKHNLPVELLDKKELYKRFLLKAPAALVNYASAQLDPYAAASHLINYHKKHHKLKVYTHTEVIEHEATANGYRLQTSTGKTIHAEYVVIATGFESEKFLPEKVMDLTSTYAIISQPMDKKLIWPENSLIWETKEPYLYVRTTNKNRVIVGGEDENFKDPVERDKLLRKKVEILEKKIKKLFPGLPFVTDMAWCGTFSSTEDGLPYIGAWPGRERMLFALGYGGNGITFSMIAAQMIRNKLKGIRDDREKIFGFEREKKK